MIKTFIMLSERGGSQGTVIFAVARPQRNDYKGTEIRTTFTVLFFALIRATSPIIEIEIS